MTKKAKKLDVRGTLCFDRDEGYYFVLMDGFVLTDGQRVWRRGMLDVREIEEMFHDRRIRIRIEEVK